MFIAEVTGTVVATRKHESLTGTKLLLIRPLDGGRRGQTLVAVDAVGAGKGEVVLVTTGSGARLGLGVPHAPVDMTIVGIVDKVEGDVKGFPR
ncbi:EutN/CcmL family microcompartment protein [Moorellaceae bacterium AZ2]|uniref:EutN/CcmL family microcompartment protein n=1 Tax=Thermanaeromonas sp. C210 TaxID=2731925 RepID=UPI00155B64FD|nr:EutN/CcmL family microcompartment protein [Thermanaeromonas sp. C210]MBE3581987.1 EutN/CcmL family microcompartment protein [Thermoanaerobacteraceae bacterium]GFN23275.1 ethanolamine utilization protein EutN [Thermanaeromonas sp. C210]